MKIAIDARFLQSTTGRYTAKLLEHLQEVDKDNQYVVILATEDYKAWHPTAPNFTKTASSAPPYTFREQLQLLWQLYKLRADIVHFNSQNLPLLYLKPYVATIHDLTQINFVADRGHTGLKGVYKYRIKPLVFRMFMWWVSKTARHIITPTAYVKNQIMDRYNLSDARISYTHEAAEPLSASPKPYTEVENMPFLLYVGNAFPHKNLQVLVDAFARIKQSRTELKLVIAGKFDASHQQLREYVDHHEIPGVHFTGFVEDTELVWLYQNAEAYIFPSLSEGFGLPGLEAMQYRTPLISSNATCLPEVYGDAAHYFDPYDPEDLAGKIEDVLSDGSLRERLREAGQTRVQSFSWRDMAEQTLDIYKNIAK